MRYRAPFPDTRSRETHPGPQCVELYKPRLIQGGGMTTAHINRIATAVPPHDVHRPFVEFAETLLPLGTTRSLFRRMARMSGIEHRYSFVQPIASDDGQWRDAEDIYVVGNFPSTARRMSAFERY